jgi:hypothetical protein
MYSATNKGTTIKTAREKQHVKSTSGKLYTEEKSSDRPLPSLSKHVPATLPMNAVQRVFQENLEQLMSKHDSSVRNTCHTAVLGLIQYYRVATRGPHRARDHLQPGPHDYLFICTSYCRLTYFILTKGFKNGGLLCLMLLYTCHICYYSGYGLDNSAIRVRSPAEAKGFFL